MFRKRRIAAGYRAGKIEHNYRYAAIWILGLGEVMLGIHIFVWANTLLFSVGMLCIVLGTVLELISLAFHYLERRLMRRHKG